MLLLKLSFRKLRLSFLVSNCHMSTFFSSVSILRYSQTAFFPNLLIEASRFVSVSPWNIPHTVFRNLEVFAWAVYSFVIKRDRNREVCSKCPNRISLFLTLAVNNPVSTVSRWAYFWVFYVSSWKSHLYSRPQSFQDPMLGFLRSPSYKIL